MGYVCVIAGGKGGVGKTTTAVNLATAAAESHDVALLDADLQMANLGGMLGLDPAGTLHDVLAGDADLADVLVAGDAGPAVVAGDRRLDAYADADPAALRDVITDLRADYDLVVVDTGAGLSHDGLVPMDLADGILLVTTPDAVAVRDTAKTAELAGRVDGSIVGVVVTRATPETDIEAIDADLGYPVVSVVPEDSGVGTRPPIVHRSTDAPAAAAYRRLSEALERIVFEGAEGADLADTWERPTPAGDAAAPDSSPETTAASTDDSDEAEAADPSGEADTDDAAASAEAADADEAEADESSSSGVFGLFR